MSSRRWACPLTISAPALRSPTQVARPGLDQPGGDRIDLHPPLLDLPGDVRERGLDRAAHQPGVEVVARRDQSRGRGADGQVDQPVLDDAVRRDQHHQGAAVAEIDELDMLERSVGLGRHDQPGAARQARHHRRRLVQHLVQIGALRRALALDRRPVVVRELADLQQPVDEQAQPGLARQPPGGAVRRVQEPHILEIRHDVADRRG